MRCKINLCCFLRIMLGKHATVILCSKSVEKDNKNKPTIKNHKQSPTTGKFNISYRHKRTGPYTDTP